MTSEDSDGWQEPVMSRREALAGGSAAAVAVGAGLLSDGLVRRARALQAGDARIVMGDQGEDPAQDGEVAFNSPDVKIHSGGAVRNASNIGAGNPGLEPLRSVTPSSQSTVDFDQGNIDSTRRVYEIVVSGLQVASNNRDLILRVSNDGGATYESGASAYSHSRHNVAQGGGETGAGNSGDTNIFIYDFLGADNLEFFSGTIRIFHPAQSSLPTIVKASYSVTNKDGAFVSGYAGGQYNTAETVDAIRLDTVANITSGTFDLYGVRTPS